MGSTKAFGPECPNCGVVSRGIVVEADAVVGPPAELTRGWFNNRVQCTGCGDMFVVEERVDWQPV